MIESPTKATQRLVGLDSIRFVAAMTVLLMHLNIAPALRGTWPDGSIGWAFRSTVNNSLNGQAAVIVFFVISGFCIHYPRVKRPKFDVLAFYTSRYIRIALPIIVAISIWVMMGFDFDGLEIGILWSLYAELIYYTIYPLLLQLRNLWGWNTLLGLSALGSIAVILSGPLADEYQSHGVAVTWILGLPCWLLGCILAERVKTGTTSATLPSTRSIWVWRLVIWLLSVVASVLRFHSPVGFPITLNIFAIAVFFWLEREILWARARGAVPTLEWAGLWSYSIYLMHMPAAAAVAKLGGLAGISFGLANPLAILTVLVGCYLFYRLIEAPSHRLAKTAARFIASRRHAFKLP